MLTYYAAHTDVLEQEILLQLHEVASRRLLWQHAPARSGYEAVKSDVSVGKWHLASTQTSVSSTSPDR